MESERKKEEAAHRPGRGTERGRLRDDGGAREFSDTRFAAQPESSQERERGREDARCARHCSAVSRLVGSNVSVFARKSHACSDAAGNSSAKLRRFWNGSARR